MNKQGNVGSVIKGCAILYAVVCCIVAIISSAAISKGVADVSANDVSWMLQLTGITTFAIIIYVCKALFIAIIIYGFGCIVTMAELYVIDRKQYIYNGELAAKKYVSPQSSANNTYYGGGQ